MNLQKLIKDLKSQGLYDEWLENRLYWHSRAEELEDLLTSKAQSYLSSSELHDKLVERLKIEMLEWYARYNPQSIAEINAPLNKKELSSFKKVIAGYIGVKFIDGVWRKQLKNLQNRKSITRFEEIAIRIRQNIEELTYQKAFEVNNLMKDVFETSYYHTFYSNNAKVIKIDDKTFNLIAKKPWTSDGSNFSERIWGKYRPELVRKLEVGLKDNIIKGEKPDKLINLIQKESNVDLNKVARLVYTEKAYFQSKGQYEAFKKLGVKQFEFVATLDLKTSEICRYMDGKVFEMSEFEVGINVPPLHPNCRSVTAPFFDRISERIQRDPKTEKSHYGANMSYNEWYEKNVFNNPKALTEEKKNRNKSNDKEQYEKYRSILGSKAPKTFESFQEIKYNDVDKYRTLKLDYEAISYIKKNIKWTDEFKERCVNMFFNLMGAGIHPNHHGVVRSVQREIPIDGIVEVDKLDFNYIDDDVMIKLYNGLALFYKENRFHSLYKLKKPKERWVKYDK